MKNTCQRRVLYVLNGFQQGGAEIGLATLLEHGFMKGVDFRVFAFMPGSKALSDRIAGVIGKENIIIATQDEKLGLRTLFASGRLLFQTLKSFRPSVAILSLSQANVIGRFLLFFFPAIRCVTFEHSSYLTKKIWVPLYKAILWSLSLRTNEVWADCQTTLDETKCFYTPWPKRTRQIVPLFCCAKDLETKKTYGLRGPFRLAMAGRVISSKRHDMVLHAMAQMIHKGIDCTLTIFGTGQGESDVRALAKTLDIEQRVFFRGYVANWWRQAGDCDVFVHPSEREGFCIVAAEAMMIGLPVVATFVGGIRDYGENEVNILLLSDASVETLEQRIMALYKNESLRQRIGEEAAKNIACRFSDDSLKKTLVDLTNRLV